MNERRMNVCALLIAMLYGAIIGFIAAIVLNIIVN